MTPDFHERQSLARKFGCALRGLKQGILSESNFIVHFMAAAVAVAVGVALRIERIEWCLITLCIAAVLAAEMFNTALERLAKAITRETNPHIAEGLNISSAAVLMASLGAVGVGAVVFVHRLGMVLNWWPT